MAKKKNKSAGVQAKAEAQGAGGKIKQFTEFLEQSKVEIKKVVWPTQKETIQTCTAVLVLVVVMSLFLGVVDMGLSKLVETILS
ncbi:preprotein translocase subunit SecE [Desulfovibrio sp. JC022]|uniref:preprotein translocase subunit SecE n=1 Tax=Desulfovibrio sp. JC022 TaxID=2593642 RepID=UPI0010A9AC48|nr:preprotein translocase subunit SecE [Desulfovibrio sp. JC022]NDV21612.1 preprotein translocase subunit SecE [Desulfovibrio sp. JC022]TIH15230.1 preprotein translocase subunit SecE [Marinifilum sp. JC120]